MVPVHPGSAAGGPAPNYDGPFGESLPSTIGSYVLERRVSGGEGYVDYDARHRVLEHRVCFRHERWPSRNPGPEWDAALAALRRSRRLQAELNHARVALVLDFFQDRGEWFTVFAYTSDAPSLRDSIRLIHAGDRPPFAIDEFVQLSAGITDGLAAIHDAGFVHRTLGSNNLLVDARGQPFLSDLGCATPIDVDDAGARAFRSFMKPTTAAPEQFSSDAPFSPAVDTWALGVVLFELRYGRHPFWLEKPTDLLAVETAILTCEPSFPESTASADWIIDDDDLLRGWLARLLEKDAERRYHDALEAQRDLNGIAAKLAGRRPRAHAFVAMPFAEEYDGIWRALWSAGASSLIQLDRADRSHRRENIWDEICDLITASDFVIAVASPDSNGAFNANVMLEIGYARARNKPVLLLTDVPDRLPFDLRTQRALVFETGMVGAGAFHRDLLLELSGMVDRLIQPST